MITPQLQAVDSSGWCSGENAVLLSSSNPFLSVLFLGMHA